MAWAGPSSDHPVWCTSLDKGGPTSQNVSCTTVDPSNAGPEVAQVQPPEPGGLGRPQSGFGSSPHPVDGGEGQLLASPLPLLKMPAHYEKFTSQMDLGKYLTAQYHIRTPEQLSSCETCHR